MSYEFVDVVWLFAERGDGIAAWIPRPRPS